MDRVFKGLLSATMLSGTLSAWCGGSNTDFRLTMYGDPSGSVAIRTMGGELSEDQERILFDGIESFEQTAEQLLTAHLEQVESIDEVYWFDVEANTLTATLTHRSNDAFIQLQGVDVAFSVEAEPDGIASWLCPTVSFDYEITNVIVVATYGLTTGQLQIPDVTYYNGNAYNVDCDGLLSSFGDLFDNWDSIVDRVVDDLIVNAISRFAQIENLLTLFSLADMARDSVSPTELPDALRALNGVLSLSTNGLGITVRVIERDARNQVLAVAYAQQPTISKTYDVLQLTEHYNGPPAGTSWNAITPVSARTRFGLKISPKSGTSARVYYASDSHNAPLGTWIVVSAVGVSVDLWSKPRFYYFQAGCPPWEDCRPYPGNR